LPDGALGEHRDGSAYACQQITPEYEASIETMINRVFLQRLFMVGILIVGVLLLSILVFRYRTVTILVPAADISAGTKIEATMLKQEVWPEAGSFKGIVVDPASIVGQTTQISLPANAPISLNALGQLAQQAADPRYPAMISSENNKMIVFVRSDLVRSTGNTVIPGERVNIVRVDPISLEATVIFQRVLVIAARSDTGLNLDLNRSIVSAGPTTIPAGYLLALVPNNALELLKIPAAQLTLVPTGACSPFLPLIISEQAADQAAAACGGSTPGASSAPTGSGTTPSAAPAGTTPSSAPTSPVLPATPRPSLSPVPSPSA